MALAALISAGWAGIQAPILSDEVFSLETAAMPLDRMLNALRADVHPPLYYLLMHYWMKAAPAGVVGLRLFSLLCAALSLVWFGRLMQRLKQPVGAAAALLAANPLVIVMASYGRMYTLLLLVCIAALDCTVRILDAEDGPGPRAGLAAALTAGLLTHNWFIFFICGAAVWAWWEYRGRALRLLTPAAAGILAYAMVWGPATFAQATARSQHLAWLRRPGVGALSDTLIAQLWLPAIALPVWLIAVALKKRTPLSRNAAWVAALICVLIPWSASQWRPLYNVRFTIIAAPFIAWALAGAASRAVAFSAVLIVLSAGWPAWQAGRQPTCSSASAANVLRTEARPGDTVIFCRLTRKPVEWYWDGPNVARTSFPSSIDTHPGYEGASSPEELALQAQNIAERAGGRVFVLADSGAIASQLLLRAFTEDRGRPSPPRLACADPGKHYFNQLVVFDAAPKMAGSRDAGQRE